MSVIFTHAGFSSFCLVWGLRILPRELEAAVRGSQPETARIIRVHIAGEAKKWAEMEADIVAGGVVAVSPSGVLGDPTGASAEEGARLVDDLVAGLAAEVARWADD